jgi:hypothetical protein
MAEFRFADLSLDLRKKKAVEQYCVKRRSAINRVCQKVPHRSAVYFTNIWNVAPANTFSQVAPAGESSRIWIRDEKEK